MQVKFRQKFEHDIKEICSQKVLNAVAKTITSVENVQNLLSYQI